ncbi:MAG: hypothetical protein GWM98_00195 [Nitrospinaceae bacterium]|nr:hypothetical protein [Nitrospinaceae bacterium]NIW57532.1 hypothetical protein [Nitrospinaceae bacterium]NIY13408.1 hypothetical protein [Nitrospinaceae bacterium]
MSFWNPSAANSQARNQTDAADCSATSTSNTANSGFQIATTTNSAANPGDTLSLHWAADAEL